MTNNKTNNAKKVNQQPAEPRAGVTPAQATMQNQTAKLVQNQKLYWGQSQMAWLVGTEPIDNSIIERMKQRMEKLCIRLLRIGGSQVCIPFEEPFWWSEIMAKKGKVLSGRKVIMQQGEPSMCHMNSIRLYQKNKRKYMLYKGHVLSEDKIWRNHWWLVDRKGNIIETTEPRVIYFGYDIHSVDLIQQLKKLK